MRSLLKPALLGAAAAAALAIGFAELVLDWRTPRSLLTERHVLSIESGLAGVTGLIAVGRRQEPFYIRFPFHIAPGEDIDRVDRKLASALTSRFGQSLPQSLLRFTDDDWSIDQCVRMPPGLGFGSFGALLGLRQGTACVVEWKGPVPASMLVVASTADGDPWMRPFVRRLCRSITNVALDLVGATERESPRYAACILADRPRRPGAQEALAIEVYDIRLYRELARIE